VHFPATMADMLRGGYKFQQTKECGDCGRLVHWFRTPTRREAPFVKNPIGRFVSHFAMCAAARIRHADAAYPAQLELFPSDVVSSFAPRA
jgi:hypothetical protein